MRWRSSRKRRGGIDPSPRPSPRGRGRRKALSLWERVGGGVAPAKEVGEAMRFKNKIALITAAANGIGRATAEIMASEGAVVVAIDNHQERLDAAINAL